MEHLINIENIKQLKRYITLLLTFIVSQVLFCQTYNFEHYNVEEGLPQSQVNSITQDKQGYLWIATSGGGLSRFDGLTFTNYNEQNGLAGNIVTSICTDKDGNIWATSTWGGVTRYNGRKFFAFTVNDGLLSNESNVIFCDNSNKIWIGSKEGVSTYFNGNFKNYSKNNNSILNENISCITQDSKGNIWIGGSNGITYISEKDTMLITQENGLISNSVSAITEDFNGNILIGTQNKGIVRLLKGSIDSDKQFKFETLTNLTNPDFITSITKDKTKNIWISTANDGIYLLKTNEEVEHITKENGLNANNLATVFEDKSGNIWIGANGGGLIKYANKAFSYYDKIEGLNSHKIFGITIDNHKNIWTISVEDGIYKYDGEKSIHYTTSNGLPSNSVRDVVKDNKGDLWFATKKGLVRYNGSTFKTFTTKNGLPINYTKTLLIDKKGVLWIGTYGGGLCKYENNKFTTYTSKDGLSHNYIHSLFEDSKGNVWIGTGNGVNKLKDGKIANYSSSNGFCNAYIGSITEDKYGKIWFGTDRCLVTYNGIDFKSITVDDGLTSGVIYFLHTDKRGNIWSGTNKGLDKITLNSYGQIDRIKNYSAKQGFKSIECNSGAIYEDEKGNLWIGAVKGLTKYDPTEDRTNVFQPNIHINDIKLFFENVDWLSYSRKLIKWNNLPQDLVLNHNENHLTFEFSAINLTFPEDIQYRFKLTPFDKEWFKATEKTSPTYSNLPPGNYIFEVKARNEDGLWNQQPASYKFIITAPWYKKWWAILLFTVISFYIIYKISSFKELQQRKISKELEIKVKERTVLIEAQRDEKEILLKEIHHRVKNNMQVIISLLSIQSGYTKDKVALALFDEAKNRIRSMALIHEKMYQTGDLAYIDIQDYMVALTNDLISTYSINCDIVLDIKIDNVKFDIDTIIPLGLLLNEIISNALKYAFKNQQKGKIGIHLTFNKKDNTYTLRIGDNGIGMPKETFERDEGTLGIELIKTFATQLDGDIQMMEEHEGTCFEMTFKSKPF